MPRVALHDDPRERRDRFATLSVSRLAPRGQGAGMTKLIATYLQDHHAGSAAGLDAFARVAEGHADAAVREAVGRIGEEAAADQKALEGVMQSFDASPALLKDLPARVAEKAARLKPNQRLIRRSPLSDVLEVEALLDAVHAKSVGWTVLLQLDDDRLDKAHLQILLERAEDQSAELRRLLQSQASKLLES